MDLPYDRARHRRRVCGALSLRPCAKIAEGDGFLGATASPETGQGRSGGTRSMAALHLSQAKKKPLIGRRRYSLLMRRAFDRTPLCIRPGPGAATNLSSRPRASATRKRFLERWIFTD